MPSFENNSDFVYYVLTNDRLLFMVVVIIVLFYLYRFLRERNIGLQNVWWLLRDTWHLMKSKKIGLPACANLLVEQLRSDRFWTIVTVTIAVGYLSGFIYYNSYAAGRTLRWQRISKYKVGDRCTLLLEYPAEAPLEALYTPGRPLSVRLWLDTWLDQEPYSSTDPRVCSSVLDSGAPYIHVVDIGPVGHGIAFTDDRGEPVPPTLPILPALTQSAARPDILYLRQAMSASSDPVTLTVSLRLFDADGKITHLDPRIVSVAPVVEAETEGQAMWRHFLKASFSLGPIQWLVTALIVALGGWRSFKGIQGWSTRQAPEIRGGGTTHSDPADIGEHLLQERDALGEMPSLRFRSDLFITRRTEQRWLGAVIQTWRERKRKDLLREKDQIFGLTGERGIGKTWLLRHTAETFSGEGCYPAYLDLNDRHAFPSPQQYVDDAIARLPHRPVRGAVDTVLILDHVPPSPQDAYVKELQDRLVLPQLRECGSLIIMALASPSQVCWTRSNLRTPDLMPVSCLNRPMAREHLKRLGGAGLARQNLDPDDIYLSGGGHPLLNRFLACFDETEARERFLSYHFLRIPPEERDQVRNYLEAVCTLTDLRRDFVTEALDIYHSYYPTAEGFPTSAPHVRNLLVRHWLARIQVEPPMSVSLTPSIALAIRRELRTRDPGLYYELKTLVLREATTNRSGE